ALPRSPCVAGDRSYSAASCRLPFPLPLRAFLAQRSIMSTIRVFPVPALALGHPLHRLLEALGPGFFALGFLDPFAVFALVTGAEGVESGVSLLVLLERGGEIRRYDELPFHRFLPNGLDPFVVELDCSLDKGGELFFRRQFVDRGDAAELSHGIIAAPVL